MLIFFYYLIIITDDDQNTVSINDYFVHISLNKNSIVWLMVMSGNGPHVEKKCGSADRVIISSRPPTTGSAIDLSFCELTCRSTFCVSIIGYNNMYGIC